MSFPNFTFWSNLLATVGVEVCGLAALGFVAQRFFRPAAWQRAVWQMIVICLLLLPASEWTGFGRGTAGFLFGQERVIEKAPPYGFTAIPSAIVSGPVAPQLNIPLVAPPPEVWWPGWIWLTGAIIVLGRMAAAQVLLLTLRLRREKIASRPLRDRVEYVANCVGLRRKVSLLRMPKAISPMAFGIVRPSIGLPPGFEAKLSQMEQDAVLAHELAHLAALDPLWFLLADFASALLWWHPLVWWMRRSLHSAAELAADEATALVPDGPGALATCLVALGKEMTAARAWGLIGINGGFRSNLGQRVERLVRMSGNAKRPLPGWFSAVARIAMTVLVVPTIVLLCGAFQSAHAQKEDSWRGHVRDSWNNSPGAVLLLAALETNAAPISTPTVMQKQKPDLAKAVDGAKLLYELGKYDEAEAILIQVTKDDPSNRHAPYYLDLIKEARYMEQSRKNGALPISPQTQLLTKIFKVNPSFFVQGLKKLYPTNLDSGIITKTNEFIALDKMVRRYFSDVGVDLRPPKNIFINDRLGLLMVRAPLSDLEIIQHAIELLNPTLSLVMIEAKFVELSHVDHPKYIIFPASGGIVKATNGTMTVGSNFVFPGSGTLASRSITNTTSILSPAEFRAAINAIEQRPDTHIVASLKVTTESGRQMVAKSTEGGEPVEISAVATVAPDGFSIQMAVLPTTKLGYQTLPDVVNQNLWDGQTLLVLNEIPNQPPGERKVHMVFITPIIIDPAGNRVHTDEEIAKRRGLPEQRQ